MNSKEKFFSVNNAVSKKEFKENLQKLNYQRKSISDIENKHKEWSKIINEKFNLTPVKLLKNIYELNIND